MEVVVSGKARYNTVLSFITVAKVA